jgi:hypothetical protein
MCVCVRSCTYSIICFTAHIHTHTHTHTYTHIHTHAQLLEDDRMLRRRISDNQYANRGKRVLDR